MPKALEKLAPRKTLRVTLGPPDALERIAAFALARMEDTHAS